MSAGVAAFATAFLVGGALFTLVFVIHLEGVASDLRRIREVLECENTSKVPVLLRRIAINTKKQPRRQKAVR